MGPDAPNCLRVPDASMAVKIQWWVMPFVALFVFRKAQAMWARVPVPDKVRGRLAWLSTLCVWELSALIVRAFDQHASPHVLWDLYGWTFNFVVLSLVASSWSDHDPHPHDECSP